MKTVFVFMLMTSSVFGARPNIVYILADDMGVGDVMAYNKDSRFPTPHIDRMASEGMH